jgi:hypothetical protein
VGGLAAAGTGGQGDPKGAYTEAPGPEGNGDFEIGPNYSRDPDLTDQGKPKGKSFSFTMPLAESMIFDGVVANQRTAKALAAKGYDYRFVFSKSTGHCAGKVFDETLADTLVWMWRGYHAE